MNLKKRIIRSSKNINLSLHKLKNKAGQIPYKHFCKLSSQLKERNLKRC
ncbi:putative hypothetical protein domain protein [Mycoplasmoides gallisepticum CA06_2006.052-5-2P]|uniref:Uncharacterized protein n=1 Tax=Mycoplasmoides gallisepticum WI01_2001.043-13-2P TaxID=1159201 RepID=J3YTQ9_MYCGL|nr:putative hypothetical protein domain protein [Mycoplasmoides gallisepticum VA94_7994-1-7P]AFP77071.1 putative hypothetical protein domain protein [Mycoplasmoides gallisepticum NC95_13295-2-2P]AFP77829.1 putative hypothetical protein domain protein [Mycoplasmoides gallisepticum NC96_1596-4-2P]AFP78595.1 putative hypothetical protein domain protein [Mycoplasmoides gallisepticum NY01_2001.047-5-1P]AFP79356.1 putative hypothetical protein domain protein [Mycoplasmoides gallisepticum WI01_2001.04